MLELKAGAFYETITRMVGTASYIGAVSSTDQNPQRIFHKDRELDEVDRKFLLGRLEELPAHLRTLGANVTSMAVEDARGKISASYARWGHAKEGFDDINNTLRRELSLLTLLVLESKEREYFAPQQPHFGQDVAAKFVSAGVFEIDEAAKCLALGRSTACIFHLMRVMEIGIGAVRQWLNIPDPIKPAERNWGKILEKIKTEIDRRNASAVWKSQDDRELCEAAYVSLDAVKTAWRNTTMHVENKYTTDEAEHIFVAVRGFMKKIASRMDENGQPVA